MMDADLRRKCSSQGIERVRRKFTMSSVVDSYERELFDISTQEWRVK